MGVFTMPSLGADMDAGTLVEWLIKPGDAVKRGDVVAVVETQKGAIEIECFEEGEVESLDAELGAKLPVGAPLATIRSKGEAAPAAKAEPKPAKPEPKAPPAAASPAQAPKVPAPPPAVQPTSAPNAARPGQGAPPASPAARAHARERGIDLSAVTGSGPAGAIVLADVETGAPAPTSSPTPRAAPLGKPGLDQTAMRTAIANAMARSKREIPHYYLTQTVDLQAAADWLAALNAGRAPDARLLMGALVVKATALAATKVPEMNGHYSERGFSPSVQVHAGVAVALRGGGLIAPAIRDAAALSLDETMAAMRDLVARARTGRLRSSEMTDGTITISSMGETGAEAIGAVIYPPQVAILGVGAPQRRPWIADDAVAPRMTVTLTLSADHRVSDGRRGAKFLLEIDRLLQNPEAL